MNYVFSTLSTPMYYTKHENGTSGEPVEICRIFINGGANIADRRTLITPRGVVTEVSDQDLEVLKANKVFQMHMLNKFITIERHKEDANKVAKDMEPEDKSAPLTPAKVKKQDEERRKKANKE
jgi:hypothetical protein